MPSKNVRSCAPVQVVCFGFTVFGRFVPTTGFTSMMRSSRASCMARRRTALANSTVRGDSALPSLPPFSYRSLKSTERRDGESDWMRS
jgi:hypothetical protein